MEPSRSGSAAPLGTDFIATLSAQLQAALDK
jgi:hypothetical protein